MAGGSGGAGENGVVLLALGGDGGFNVQIPSIFLVLKVVSEDQAPEVGNIGCRWRFGSIANGTLSGLVALVVKVVNLLDLMVLVDGSATYGEDGHENTGGGGGGSGGYPNDYGIRW